MADERALFPYRVWIVGAKSETVCIGEFESSFAARKWLAAQHGVETWQAVAQRIFDGEED